MALGFLGNSIFMVAKLTVAVLAGGRLRLLQVQEVQERGRQCAESVNGRTPVRSGFSPVQCVGF